MPLKYLLATAVFALLIVSGCATTSQENTTYATPAGIGPVRGTGNNFY